MVSRYLPDIVGLEAEAIVFCCHTPREQLTCGVLTRCVCLGWKPSNMSAGGCVVGVRTALSSPSFAECVDKPYAARVAVQAEVVAAAIVGSTLPLLFDE